MLVAALLEICAVSVDAARHQQQRFVCRLAAALRAAAAAPYGDHHQPLHSAGRILRVQAREPFIALCSARSTHSDCSQVIKAIRRAHPDRPDALPQLADDAMFIVTRSCTRALSTQLSHAVSATVPNPTPLPPDCDTFVFLRKSIYGSRTGEQRCICPRRGVQSHPGGSPPKIKIASVFSA